MSEVEGFDFHIPLQTNIKLIFTPVSNNSCFYKVNLETTLGKMERYTQILDNNQIARLEKQFGSYLKLTIDIEKKVLVAGCELHADGEKLLLKEGSNDDDIWGGGIDLESKQIDTTAILNIRPRLQNNGIEIADNIRREKFTNLVKFFFANLWK